MTLELHEVPSDPVAPRRSDGHPVQGPLHVMFTEQWVPSPAPTSHRMLHDGSAALDDAQPTRLHVPRPPTFDTVQAYRVVPVGQLAFTVYELVDSLTTFTPQP